MKITHCPIRISSITSLIIITSFKLQFNLIIGYQPPDEYLSPVQRERIQLIEQQAAAAEKERLRVLAEEAEKERLRVLAEAAEKERLRVLAEAAEKERLRVLAEEAEKERLRLLEGERLRVIEVQRLFMLELERLRVLDLERLRKLELERLRVSELDRLRLLAIDNAALEVAERERVRAFAFNAAGTLSSGSGNNKRSSSCRRIGRITFEGVDNNKSVDSNRADDSTNDSDAVRGAESTTKTPFPYLRRKSFGGHEAKKKLSLTPEKVFYPCDRNPGFPFPYMSTSHNVKKK